MVKTDHTDGIIQATFEIGRVLRRRMMSANGKDIHMGQLHALAFIKAKNGITMKELAASMMVTSPSATSFIDRLATLGYVRRVADTTNRKLVRLAITPEGLKVLKRKTAEKKKMFMELFTPLSVADQKSLLTILHKVLPR